jgi:hypothetical protein
MNNEELFATFDPRLPFINRPIPFINKDEIFRGIQITANTPNQADFYTVKIVAMDSLKID